MIAIKENSKKKRGKLYVNELNFNGSITNGGGVAAKINNPIILEPAKQ